ncbi:MAG TPA: hypothetical protein VJL84_01040, partial [Kiloniellales bacterium]|nr:hypothetical protein [Kiloniellales bacterium]
MKTSAAALAALLLALPAAAQQPVAPDTAGVWGFAYEDLQEGQSASALAQRDVVSCLAEPALIAPAAEGYVLNAYRVDVFGLMRGNVRYFVTYENLCSYDAATGLESCRRISVPPDENVYWTWYQPLDAAAGVFRAYAFADEAEVEAFKKSGAPPETATRFVTFPCPADQQPRPALLEQATRDDAASQASYDNMLGNYRRCDYP